MVEGRPFYAHKIIVSMLSERFRTMLQSGLQESEQHGRTVVKIEGISYHCFGEMMRYLYSGKFDYLDSI